MAQYSTFQILKRKSYFFKINFNEVLKKLSKTHVKTSHSIEDRVKISFAIILEVSVPVENSWGLE